MKRILSLLLSLALVFTLLPMQAAAKSEAWDGSVDISWYDPAKSEYYLSTPAQLAGLAALVNGMADPAAAKITGDKSYLKSIRVDNVMLVGAGGGNVFDTVYTSDIDFAGKTVYLTADLDMGGVYDAGTDMWSGPNWTPIGGKFPMKPKEAAGDCMTLDTRFNGVLDGQGHTISNLYCDRYAEKGFPYSMAVGVVGFLGGACDNNANITADFEDGWQPAVRNLVLASGSILGRRMIGGIVGRIGETANGVIVENCANRAAVRSTDSKGVGGIVGSAWGKGCIRNCYNTGHISTIYTCPAGGILGTNEGMDVYNCYNIGTIDTNGVSYGRAIGSHDSGSYTVENCYYLAGCDDDPSANGYYKGVSKKIGVSCYALSANEITNASFLVKVNANGAIFAADEKNINGGYPVLWFENGGGEGTCTVTAETPQHGTLTISTSGETACGATVTMTAEAEAGYLLDHFTVNGKAIAGNFFAVTADSTIGAVFKKVRTATLRFADSDAYYLAVRRTGWRMNDDGTMTLVTNEPVHSGETLLEGNVLTLLTHEYEDAVPADSALEYRSGVLYTVTGTEKNTDGTYSVTGSGTVTITGVRNTRAKSWAASIDKSWFTGRQNTYTLTTAAQLAGLSALVSGGESFEGVTVKLGNDISLTRGADGAGRVWTAIGTSMSRAFRGTFDGQGHAVTGLRAESASSYCALFGCTVGAAIKNLTVCGTSSGSAAASYAAGIVAYADGCTIENCASYVDVTASGTHVGGIAAYICNGTRLKDCTNYGDVTAASGVGGLAGISYSGEDSIEGCANFGTVTSTRSATYGTGGLLGRLAGTLTRSAFYGEVTSADRYTGGLAGYTTARNKTTITLCRAEGTVKSTNTDARAATGSIAGYAQNLRWGGCESAESALPQLGREGTVQTIAASGEIPVFTAKAEPEDVPADMTEESESQQPQRPAMVENNTVTLSGTYYIPWFSTGELTVGDGLTVTLCGAYGPFDGLRITADRGAAVTLEDVSLAGETTLLTLRGGNTLTLTGTNHLDGRSDAPDDPDPTVSILGDVTIDGTGSMSVTAQVNNACVLAEKGIRITQKGGTLSVLKTDKLGFAGGAFCANGAQVEITGGTFAGRTDSDNVAVLSADTIRVSNANVRVESEKSPTAFLGKVTLENAVVSARSHTGNSAKVSAGYENAAALGTSVTQTGVTWKTLLPFADVTAEELAYDDVAYCVERGWLKGVSADRFAPDGDMTRAMFVTALYRAAGSPAVTGGTPFADLKSDWYRKAVAWAVENGIVQGTTATTFSPDAAITVEQAAVLMQRWRTGGNAGSGSEESLPAGVGAVSQWARGGVKWACGAGMLTVSELADPSAPASRMLLASLLHRSAK